jgi:hypothetical protein
VQRLPWPAVTGPAVDAVLAGFTSAELLALYERRWRAEQAHADHLAGLAAEAFWTDVESDPETVKAFARLVQGEHRLAERAPIRDSISNDGPRHPDRYGRAALESELAQLASIEAGQRNVALNRSSYKLGRLVAAGLLEEHTARIALEQAGETLGLHPWEAKATVRSGLDAGMGKP